MGFFFTINMKLEHIGIAVKDLKSSTKLFSELFDQESYKLEEVHSEGVRTSFFRVGESKVELLEGTTSESPISKFIDKKGEGIHHLAFEVKDIQSEIDRLTKLGYQLINSEPKDGADNKRIVFLHPKSTNGVLVELCQEKT